MPKYITNAPTEGTVLGQNTTDKIGFYGLSTAVTQQTISAGVPVSSATTISTLQLVISTLATYGLIRAT